ncbi:hypothetical protein [Tropicibacter oceani]|uniref:DUF4105 domain-containing protein n=1 Tax=Tropicibacter oceani TaxID=3058420 RepID=A0ABY8QFX7_9RHOB|nr:hypothetical protein [Tropicibacter oceani]WGW02916.1 hypothetical protein QF118_13335 [Tropicibacter oceani]
MQNKFTVVTPVKPGQQAGIVSALKGHDLICPDTGDDPFGFARIDTLHFASLALFDDPEDGWSLVFEHNIDGPIEAHLQQLIDTAQRRDDGAFLLSLYGHCTGGDVTSLAALRDYMLQHVLHPAAGFISAVNMTRDQIRLDASVYKVVDRTLGAAGVALPPDQAQTAVLKALDDDPATKDRWHQVPDPGTGLSLPAKIRAGLALLLHGIGFLVLALWNLIKERAATEDRARPDPDLRRSLEIAEDFIPTNHMISVVYLHTDPGRQLAKRMGLGLLRNLVTLVFRKSFLGEINTIHFAHWSFANDNRRLIFVSNYDGSWRSYLDDFTLKASAGLNLAWAHSLGFPKTWFMLKGGAAKGPEFIDYARRSMVPTLVWYSAYPSVSVTNITRNRQLRADLKLARKGSRDTSWLEHV